MFDIQADPFSDFADANDEFHQLLELLHRSMPEVCFQLILNNGDVAALEGNLALSEKERADLVETTRGQKNLVHFELPQGRLVCALPVIELDAVLLMGWFNRVFISPLMRWDTAWYQRILTQGYRPEDGTSSFHPLFPLLARPLVASGLDASMSLLIISALAGLAYIYFWVRLASLDLNPDETRFSILVFLFFPMSFILFVPYTEALFLLLSTSFTLLTLGRRKLHKSKLN